MKKSTFALTLVLLTLAGAASAYDPRVESARLAVEVNREYRGDNEFRADRDWRRRDGRTAYEIERLNREVRRLRDDLRRVRVGPRLRLRFSRVENASNRLTFAYQQRRLRGGEVRRRAEQLQEEVFDIRRDLRGRRSGRGLWQ